MSRVQLALNVKDLDASIEFYTKLFGVEPHKVREGYANFAVQDPPLKLVLIEGPEGGTLNHLGVEVDGTGEVQEAIDRLSGKGLQTREEMATVCCHAQQDKVWVNDPAGAPWEVYTITDDNPQSTTLTVSPSGCCTPTESACC